MVDVRFAGLPVYVRQAGLYVCMYVFGHHCARRAGVRACELGEALAALLPMIR